MTGAFDDRLVSLSITIDKDKPGAQTFVFDQSYYIIAQGNRLTNGLFGDCALRIDNIAKQTRDYIVSRTSQWATNKTTAQVSLEVGRESYGTFQLFAGAAVASNPSQPPDIGLTLHSLAGAQYLTYANASLLPQNATLKQICQSVADNLGLQLDFQASQNPLVGNYHFNGSIGKQMQSLSLLGDIWVYMDVPNTLVVTDAQTSRKLPPVEVNYQTGMVGVPEITEIGARAIVLIKNEIKIGSPVNLKSILNPSINGEYNIFKLGFQIASRDNPFYWVMDMNPKKLSLNQGAP